MSVWFAIFFHQSLYLEISKLNTRSVSRLSCDSPFSLRSLLLRRNKENSENLHFTPENLLLRLKLPLQAAMKRLHQTRRNLRLAPASPPASEKVASPYYVSRRPFTRRRPRVFPDSGNCVSLLACCTVHLPLTMLPGPCAQYA